VGLLSVAAIGVLDYLSGYEISFGVFYLLPISYVAWAGGLRPGIFVATGSAIAWLIADHASGHPYSQVGVPYWNAASRWAIFVLTAILVDRSHISAQVLHEKVAQKTAELRESEGKFRALAESSAAAIFISQEDRLVYANAATARIVGLEPREMLGRGFWEFIHPDWRKLVRERREERLRGADVPSRYEMKVLTADGKERWIDFTATVVEWDRRPAVLGTAIDITEPKQLEEQFRQAQKMEAVGQLAGGVAHDFNNLLGVIIGYAELLAEEVGTQEPLSHQINEVQKAGKRAADLTKQLLAFSRQQVLEVRVLNVNQAIRDMSKMLRRLIGEDVELITSLDPALGSVKADRGQFDQVIMNLAVNARDAMPQGGQFTVETANVELDEGYVREHYPVVPGRYVMLAVSDTGIGINEETQRHIFEPFFTTKEPGKGTGLGLATVYGIVKQSGGYIWVYSEVGQGTTFKIYFPRVEEPAEKTEKHEEKIKSLRGSETVLVVEDDGALREVTCEFLRQAGYTVLAAKDGTEALTVAEQYQGPIHVLVTDVVMPRMGGSELVERLKATRPGIAVLYASGYASQAFSQRILEEGLFFLPKPFTREGMCRKLQEVLGSTRQT